MASGDLGELTPTARLLAEGVWLRGSGAAPLPAYSAEATAKDWR